MFSFTSESEGSSRRSRDFHQKEAENLGISSSFEEDTITDDKASDPGIALKTKQDVNTSAYELKHSNTFKISNDYGVKIQGLDRPAKHARSDSMKLVTEKENAHVPISGKQKALQFLKRNNKCGQNFVKLKSFGKGIQNTQDKVKSGFEYN